MTFLKNQRLLYLPSIFWIPAIPTPFLEWNRSWLLKRRSSSYPVNPGARLKPFPNTDISTTDLKNSCLPKEGLCLKRSAVILSPLPTKDRCLKKRAEKNISDES